MGQAQGIDELGELDGVVGAGPHRISSHHEIATGRRAGVDVRVIVKNASTKVVLYDSHWHATVRDEVSGAFDCTTIIGHEIVAAPGWSGNVVVDVCVEGGELKADIALPGSPTTDGLTLDITYRWHGVET